MAKVFLSPPSEPESLLGYVNAAGDVFLSQAGAEEYLGRVDPSTGKIFQARFGPDDYVGHVALDSGKVYRQRHLLPDQQLGQVLPDGQLLAASSAHPEEPVARVEDMPGPAHGGAALMLLVLPALGGRA